MTKKWYESTTLQGAVISALSVFLGSMPISQDELSKGVYAIFTLIGIGMSIYGRCKTRGEKITT